MAYCMGTTLSNDDADSEQADAQGLLSLPTAALWHISRQAGLPVRRVCRTLRDAYGPPDGTLRLAGDAATLLHALTTDCRHLTHTSGLILQITPLAPALMPRPEAPIVALLLQAIAPTAPRLRSLALSLARPTTRPPRAGPTTFEPLGPTLTALTLNAHPLVSLLAPLTSLRSLHLSTTHTTRPHLQSLLRALTLLPHLHTLHFDTHWDSDCSDNSWLPLFPLAVPHLTSLSVGVLLGWDATADSTLRGSFSGLRCLSLTIADALPPPLHLPPPLCSSLPHRLVPLQELHLHLLLAPEAPPRLPPALQLRSLQVTSVTSSGWANAVLPALRHQTLLTRLSISFMPADSPTQLLDRPAMAALQGTLQELHLTCHASVPTVLRHAPSLPALRALGLHCRTFPPQGPDPAAAQLSQVTTLTRLIISALVLPGSLLRHTSHLPALQHLTLQEVGWHATRSNTDAVDLRHLLAGPLRHSLTSLTLDGADSLRGHSLAAVRDLPALQELQVARLRHVEPRVVEAALVPLPRALRALDVAGLRLTDDVRGRLRAAALRQDCRWCHA